MNTKQLYVFQDSVSGNYSDTFTANTEKEAIRIFARSVAMSGIPDAYRADLVLKHLGEITTDDNGEIYVRGFEVARHVLRGSAPEVDADIKFVKEVSGDVEVADE